jgi:hypothetical protein
MSSGFRRQHTLITRSPQVYDPATGDPVAPITSTGTFMASIQPAKLTDYDEAAATALGVDLTRSIRIYTDQRLNVYDRSTQSPGDMVVFLGTNYIVFAESIWQAMGSSIDHFRYLATRDEITS